MSIQTGYRARPCVTEADLAEVQRLRFRAFRPAGRAGAAPDGTDADRFDPMCRHLMVEEGASGRLVATVRLLPLASGAEIGDSYAAQFYALEALEGYPAPMLEMGRLCVAPGETDANILRTVWGAVTRMVDQSGSQMVFGCSSFRGTDSRPYAHAFAMLRDRHLAPRRWWPRVKAPKVFRFARRLRRKPDPAKAMRAMPPLLRTYLAMGGWVSDHAVIDHDLDTLHVFTALEVRAIPPARKRVLRALAAG